MLSIKLNALLYCVGRRRKKRGEISSSRNRWKGRKLTLIWTVKYYYSNSVSFNKMATIELFTLSKKDDDDDQYPLASFFFSLSIYLYQFGYIRGHRGTLRMKRDCQSMQLICYRLRVWFGSLDNRSSPPPPFSWFAISIVVPSLYNIEDVSLYVKVEKK